MDSGSANVGVKTSVLQNGKGGKSIGRFPTFARVEFGLRKPLIFYLSSNIRRICENSQARKR